METLISVSIPKGGCTPPKLINLQLLFFWGVIKLYYFSNQLPSWAHFKLVCPPIKTN
jgi:hypothetical protein